MKQDIQKEILVLLDQAINEEIEVMGEYYPVATIAKEVLGQVHDFLTPNIADRQVVFDSWTVNELRGRINEYREDDSDIYPTLAGLTDEQFYEFLCHLSVKGKCFYFPNDGLSLDLLEEFAKEYSK